MSFILPHFNLVATNSEKFGLGLMQVLHLFHGCGSEEGTQNIIHSDNGFEQVLSVIFIQRLKDVVFLVAFLVS
jgi:hypothetical protein